MSGDPTAFTDDEIRQKLAKLSLRQSQVLYLHCFGLSHRQVGEVLGMTDNTVGTHLMRAVAKLEINYGFNDGETRDEVLQSVFCSYVKDLYPKGLLNEPRVAEHENGDAIGDASTEVPRPLEVVDPPTSPLSPQTVANWFRARWPYLALVFAMITAGFGAAMCFRPLTTTASLCQPGRVSEALSRQNTVGVVNRFANLDGTLLPPWNWQIGSSSSSSYRVYSSGERLTLSAAPGTSIIDGVRTAPILALPVCGDFTVQTRLDFEPYAHWQVALLSVRGRNAPGDGVDIRRFGDSLDQRVEVLITRNNHSNVLVRTDWTDRFIYVRLSRRAELITAEVSEDGVTWRVLKSDIVLALPQDVEIWLSVCSTTPTGISATYSQFEFKGAVSQSTVTSTTTAR